MIVIITITRMNSKTDATMVCNPFVQTICKLYCNHYHLSSMFRIILLRQRQPDIVGCIFDKPSLFFPRALPDWVGGSVEGTD